MTTTHDRCIYRIVIYNEVIYLLRMVDNCMLLYKEEKTVKNILNIIDKKIRFATEKEKCIIIFEFRGVVNDYNDVDIKQTSFYIEISCECYIKQACKTND